MGRSLLVLGLMAAGVVAGILSTRMKAPVPEGVVVVDEPLVPLKTDLEYLDRAHRLLKAERYDDAIADLDAMLRLAENKAPAYHVRGFAWHLKSVHEGDPTTSTEKALADYNRALQYDTKYAPAINSRAALYATTRVDHLRDGKKALKEAARACDLTDWKDPICLDTLALAYAETGDFNQAILWQHKALEFPDYKQTEGTTAAWKLEHFANRQPYRE
jgi:tetratricopeptide (TPR) repeat protein